MHYVCAYYIWIDACMYIYIYVYVYIYNMYYIYVYMYVDVWVNGCVYIICRDIYRPYLSLYNCRGGCGSYSVFALWPINNNTMHAVNSFNGSFKASSFRTITPVRGGQILYLCSLLSHLPLLPLSWWDLDSLCSSSATSHLDTSQSHTTDTRCCHQCTGPLCSWLQYNAHTLHNLDLPQVPRMCLKHRGTWSRYAVPRTVESYWPY